jgi:hypothetical protein
MGNASLDYPPVRDDLDSLTVATSEAIRQPPRETVRAMPKLGMRTARFATYYFTLRPVSTDVTTRSVPFRSPITVTEFSAAAFASSFSKPDST